MSKQPAIPLQLWSFQSVQTSTVGSCSPWQGPHIPDAQLWVPSWQVPTFRVGSGPV